MAAKTINLDFLGGIGESQSSSIEPKMSKTASTVLRLAVMFAKNMASEMNKADSSSSGRGADSLSPSSIEEKGGVYSINIEGKFYLKFVDKGVNGWAKNRNSPYQFKTKGVDPNGEMVKSIKEYLTREKSFTADKYKAQSPTTNKERKRLSADVAKAVSVAYMIKRMGIKGTHFKDKALEKTKQDIRKELGEAFKQDIIANLN
jgi:hypothetical protein